MASSFPLLQLPLLPLLDILKDMDPNQLIFLSMLSKRAERIVKELNYKITAGSWQIYGNDFIGDISLSNGKRIDLNSARSRRSEENDHIEKLQLNDHVITFWRDGSRWYIGTPVQSLQERQSSMDVLNEHIFKMFQFSPTAPRFHFSCIFDTDLNLSDLSLWKHTKTFDSISLTTSVENTKFAFENLTVRHFTIAPLEDPFFRFNAPLRMDTLEISDMDGDEDINWLTWQCLSTMECRIVDVSCFVPGDSLNFMIKHWQRGGLPNLEYFEAKVDSFASVLDGIRTIRWDPENRPKFWKNKNLSSSKHFDIRGLDGSIATIDTDYKFKFYVWK